MSRDPGLFLKDIVDASRKVQTLCKEVDLASFSEDWRTHDALLHNLEIIGEAVKRIPEPLKIPYPGIPWKRIAGFRDVLAHAYFSVDDSIVFDVAVNQIGPLLEAVTDMLTTLDSKA